MRKHCLVPITDDCRLCKRVSFVGYSIGYDGMCASPGKVKAINAMKDKFENKGEIRTFMGKIQFFGQWIKDLGELAPPLYANLKDDVLKKFTEKEWTLQCTESVRLLNASMTVEGPGVSS